MTAISQTNAQAMKAASTPMSAAKPASTKTRRSVLKSASVSRET